MPTFRRLTGSLLLAAALAAPAAGQDWQGPYAGAHLGYAHADLDNRAPAFPGPTGDSGSAIGGLQIGYNWQGGSAVYGIEGDVSALDVHGRSAGGRYEERVMASLRLRAGTLLQDSLIYGTLGVAWTEKEIGLTGLGSNTEWEPGLAAGLGAERWFGDSTTGRLELLYVDVPKSTQLVGGVPTVGGSSKVILRAGVNLHF